MGSRTLDVWLQSCPDRRCRDLLQIRSLFLRDLRKMLIPRWKIAWRNACYGVTKTIRFAEYSVCITIRQSAACTSDLCWGAWCFFWGSGCRLAVLGPLPASLGTSPRKRATIRRPMAREVPQRTRFRKMDRPYPRTRQRPARVVGAIRLPVLAPLVVTLTRRQPKRGPAPGR